MKNIYQIVSVTDDDVMVIHETTRKREIEKEFRHWRRINKKHKSEGLTSIFIDKGEGWFQVEIYGDFCHWVQDHYIRIVDERNYIVDAANL